VACALLVKPVGWRSTRNERKPLHPSLPRRARNGVLTMVRASVIDGKLRLEVQGLRKLVQQSRLEFSLERVHGVRL